MRTRAAELSAQTTSRAPIPFPRAIVVLGCETDAGATPGLRLQLRLERALTEARHDPRALVVVTGTPNEAAHMRDWLLANGVASWRLQVDAAARSTLDNAINVAPMLLAAGVRSAKVVTEAFHVRRSALLLQRELLRCGAEVRVTYAPSANGASPERLPEHKRHEPLAIERDLLLQDARPACFDPMRVARGR